jgi:Protein of unknown function (DUF1706)
MSDKDKLLQDGEAAFTELRQAVTGVPEDAMGRVFLGTWGVREILAHVSGWHREMIPALARLGRGESPHPDGVSYDDFDAWNARFVEAKRGVKAAAVVAELDDSHRAFMTAAAALPDKHFADGETARSLFDGAGPAHYREHSAQIREWREQQKL